jgi:hypothetical protein
MLSWFEWLEHSWLGVAVNSSTWAFAVIEAGHLLALAALGGAILVVDMRLLGFGLNEEPVSYVGRTAQPWLIGGLAAAIVTGCRCWRRSPLAALRQRRVLMKIYSSPRWCSATFRPAVVLCASAREFADRKGRGSYPCCSGPASASWDGGLIIDDSRSFIVDRC